MVNFNDFNLEALKALYPDSEIDPNVTVFRNETSTFDPNSPWIHKETQTADPSLQNWIHKETQTASPSLQKTYSAERINKMEAYDFFLEWLEDHRSIREKINEILKDQEFLTEGDLIGILGLNSALKNPFYFLYGNGEKYQESMDKILLWASKELPVSDDNKNIYESIPYRRIEAIREALEYYESECC